MGRNLIDIACNLTDPAFRGVYNGRQKHADDFEDVMRRAAENNVVRIIVTGTNAEESRQAVDMANQRENLSATVGCHPTRCQEFGDTEEEAQRYMDRLRGLIKSSKKVVAVGELGLDYDRTMFCPADVQRKRFEMQLELSVESCLPLFLHCRNAFPDFQEILDRNRDKFGTGVVHSFDGTGEQAHRLIGMGLYIGLNGCSLKTEENLKAVKQIPADKIMLETDAPWCDIRPTHASYQHVRTKFDSRKKERFEMGLQVKNRNEPCNIVQVLEVVAGVKGMDVDELADLVKETTESVFKLY